MLLWPLEIREKSHYYIIDFHFVRNCVIIISLKVRSLCLQLYNYIINISKPSFLLRTNLVFLYYFHELKSTKSYVLNPNSSLSFVMSSRFWHGLYDFLFLSQWHYSAIFWRLCFAIMLLAMEITFEDNASCRRTIFLNFVVFDPQHDGTPT